MKRARFGQILLLLVSLYTAGVDCAEAELKSRTVIARSALWGMAAGTAAGIVSYPFAKSFGTILIGTFTGLVLGTGVGIFYLQKRDGLELDLQRSRGYDDETGSYVPRMHDPVIAMKAEGRSLNGRAPLVNFQVPILRF